MATPALLATANALSLRGNDIKMLLCVDWAASSSKATAKYVTGVTMATPALANTGTSSQPAAAAPAINQVHKETGYFKTTDKLGKPALVRLLVRYS
jgi:hypothetical protein